MSIHSEDGLFRVLESAYVVGTRDASMLMLVRKCCMFGVNLKGTASVKTNWPEDVMAKESYSDCVPGKKSWFCREASERDIDSLDGHLLPAPLMYVMSVEAANEDVNNRRKVQRD